MTGRQDFFNRWSKRKQASQQSSPPPSGADTEAPEAIPSPAPLSEITQTIQTTDNTALPNRPAESESVDNIDQAHQDLTDEDMPDLDTLGEDADFSPFMSPKVSEELRKLALRKLFQGSQFKIRDGLDDYDDDYTEFVKLGSTITSDMKHMAAVEARRQLEQAQAAQPQTPQQGYIVTSPREAALTAQQNFTVKPTGQVEYQSQGKLIIIGADLVSRAIAQLPDTLYPQIILTQDLAELHQKSFVTPLKQRQMTLHGWLGNFQLELSDGSATKTLLSADLVLDLGDEAILQRQLNPPGYFHANANSLDEVLAQLADLSGTFAKPRYFDYNADICAHSRSQLPGCQRCIEACPAEAIISIGEQIEVNPHLCQGGGGCATACPTGAIRYNYPAPADHVNQLRAMLNAWREHEGEAVSLLLHSAQSTPDYSLLPENILPFALEELASVGAEFWSTALAFGVQQVLLLEDEQVPQVSHQTLRQQISVMSTALAGLGYPDEVVRLIPSLANINDPSEVQAALATPSVMPYFPPSKQSGLNDKRQQWLVALDHLYKHAPEAEQQIPLPQGAPFGVLKVDSESCTLCMACSTVCPANALSGGTDHPQLRLHPNNCVQCGLCQQACPEQAISLKPLLIANRELRMRPITLNEERAFECVSCGKPFASEKIITNMLSKLTTHPMFQTDRAKQRLQMCEDCRVVDIVQDDDAMGMPRISS